MKGYGMTFDEIKIAYILRYGKKKGRKVFFEYLKHHKNGCSELIKYKEKPFPIKKKKLVVSPIEVVTILPKKIKKKSPSVKYRNKVGLFSAKIRKRNNIPFDLQVDHIIPVSFCRKLGVTPEQASNIFNLDFIDQESNLKKWSYITKEGEPHLRLMCLLWEIDYPSKKMIDDHNKEAQLSFDNISSKLLKHLR